MTDTTTTTTHTPGPWQVEYGCIFAGDDIVAGVAQRRKEQATIDANAHLIAAAPDLLAALDQMTHLFDHPGLYGLILRAKRHGWTDDDVQMRILACRNACAAIAKAKGE